MIYAPPSSVAGMDLTIRKEIPRKAALAADFAGFNVRAALPVALMTIILSPCVQCGRMKNFFHARRMQSALPSPDPGSRGVFWRG